MIEGLTNAGSLPVLERMMQFAARRHSIISHNVANLTTPGFRQMDVSVDAFQTQLREAVDVRRERSGAAGGHLDIESTNQVSINGDQMQLTAEPSGTNILFQDGNDRDVERTMQALVENFLSFRSAAQLMRSEHAVLNAAIRERI